MRGDRVASSSRGNKLLGSGFDQTRQEDISYNIARVRRLIGCMTIRAEGDRVTVKGNSRIPERV